MKRHLPNILTLLRLVMAFGIFALLASYDVRHPAEITGLCAALLLFALAVITDILDGYLARRFNTSSAFGRISDPFIDKILVCGSFICFLGGNFITINATGEPDNVSGVQVWMVLIIFGREILVTGIRGFSESRGETFTATVFGKIKMSLQCATLIYLIVCLSWLQQSGSWAVWTRDLLLWATTLFTLLSAAVYFGRTQRLMMLDEKAGGAHGPGV